MAILAILTPRPSKGGASILAIFWSTGFQSYLHFSGKSAKKVCQKSDHFFDHFFWPLFLRGPPKWVKMSHFRGLEGNNGRGSTLKWFGKKWSKKVHKKVKKVIKKVGYFFTFFDHFLSLFYFVEYLHIYWSKVVLQKVVKKRNRFGKKSVNFEGQKMAKIWSIFWPSKWQNRQEWQHVCRAISGTNWPRFGHFLDPLFPFWAQKRGPKKAIFWPFFGVIFGFLRQPSAGTILKKWFKKKRSKNSDFR